MIRPIERLISVEGNLSMLCAVLRATDILKTNSGDIVEQFEACIEDLQIVIGEMQNDRIEHVVAETADGRTFQCT